MSPGALEDRSERLVSLVDELGAALRQSGVDDDAAMRLLECAAAAVLDALTLDLMLPGARSQVEERSGGPVLTLAA